MINSIPNPSPVDLPAVPRPKPWWRKTLPAMVIVLLIIAIGLIVVGGEFVSTALVGAKGGRLAVTKGTKHTVVLSNSTKRKRVELCRGTPEKCIILLAAAKGRQAIVRIPPAFAQGKAILKVSEIESGGKLTLVYRRAVAIAAAPPMSSSSSNSGGGGGGGSGGGGGGSDGGGEGGSGGTSSGSGEPAASPSALPAGNIASAAFIAPAEGETLGSGEALDVRVQLTETDLSKLTCQEWLLNGVTVAVSQWEGGQSPDLSAGPC